LCAPTTQNSITAAAVPRAISGVSMGWGAQNLRVL
jgi:hypothetical protein